MNARFLEIIWEFAKLRNKFIANRSFHTILIEFCHVTPPPLFFLHLIKCIFANERGGFESPYMITRGYRTFGCLPELKPLDLLIQTFCHLKQHSLVKRLCRIFPAAVALSFDIYLENVHI